MVETANGKLRGTISGGVASFKGISYGQSTGGRNRFLPPKPVEPWAGVREAIELGHPCVQTNEDFAVWLDPMPESEDCLALNVWAPEHAGPNSKLPVMVWLHGGGYVFGSGGAPLYDCSILADTGNVVAVSINHRLQAFGFTDLSAVGDDYAFSGNAALLDIVAALQWVRANIEAFGGDPNNVTLFGQSGGGAKIATLMGMPVAADLFHRAIVQSGSVFRYRGRAEAEAMTNRMFSVLGIARNDISALQSVSSDVLLRCGNQIMSEASGTGHPALKYAPVVDGEILPEEPWRAGAPDLAKHIPLLLGCNLDETIIYQSGETQDDAAIAKAVVSATTVYTPDEKRAAELIPVYRRALPELSGVELVVRISTDLGFWKGAVHHAEMQSKAGASVYMYRCDWKTPCFDGLWAPHSVELPFIMGHKTYGSAWDGKDTEAARDAADPNNLRFGLGDRMLAAWVNFARTGNPSLPDLNWPKYSVKARSTMIFDTRTRVVDDPEKDFRLLVSSI
ncbi:Carboxylesterase type B (plasmid) [Rhizobium leguminosarum bv. trifolii WSM2304]|uniref:Carboxylic ester hydrolase n=1 Tax=Rhizobium leguminosarum bv. trifolii (strain WSM2304) TaxID=395492 RepID=A0ABF7QZS7_RHILW|nr:Carboxylesterase type B [Rhizobium leguminosarum bv. trifolii WSM2304]